MRINIFKTPKEMGKDAAGLIAKKLTDAIASQGYARLLVSTGASQFEMFEALVQEPVEWNKVTMFHLDEYIGLSKSHKASFQKYLAERFVGLVNLREAVYVNGEGNVSEVLEYLTRRITESPIDVAVIGIGENAHVAFNDPPANFKTTDSYIVVNLDERCKQQQVGEGWFASIEEVPTQAFSITIPQIMKSKCIISVVPHAVKAEAVKNALMQEVNNQVPATILKTHSDWNLYLDAASAKLFIS